MSATVKPTIATIKAVLEALEEIELHFQWQGFDDANEEGTQIPEDEGIEGPTGDEVDEGDLSTEGPEVFDAEEIEIATDAFLSRLIEKKLLRKGKDGRAPSMSDAFDKMFGEEHEAAKMAGKFEEQVAGYFGWVSFDDMSAAYGQLMEIKEILTRMVAERHE